MKREIHVWSTIGLAAAAATTGQYVVAGGCWLGILLHPDLDQSRTLYGEFRKHRGLSHWPVVGTLDRLLWFCGPLLLALWPTLDWGILLPIVVGLVLSDTLHIGLDVLDKALVKRGVNL